MHRKLSIIIPCYNCVSTLGEALASVYTQNLTTPFEVIMVDDCSKDGTADLMITLSKNYPNVICLFNKKNHGGGATRNIGIAKSTGDLIYCLDSDNFFAPNTLQKMINFLEEKKCEGVAFSERRFFVNKNIKKYNSQFYKITDRSVCLDDMFTRNPPLLDNFLYTKKSYEEAGKYPEHHGFDTQCFELRFISTGHTVYFCPETFFYHRQGGKEKSYFERVYESGEFSKNMYLIYEDLFFLFSPDVRLKIMQYDVFRNSSMNSIEAMLQDLYAQDLKSFFIPKYKQYLQSNGYEVYVRENEKSEEVTDLFCLFIYFYKKGEYLKAIDSYKKLVKIGLETKIFSYNFLRIMTAFLYPDQATEIEKKVSVLISELQPRGQKIDFNQSFLNRLRQKFFKILKIE
jgi:glycosyltransferase involved in cell wall biosynthesis